MYMAKSMVLCLMPIDCIVFKSIDKSLLQFKLRIMHTLTKVKSGTDGGSGIKVFDNPV